jgi:hypothetical protein
MFQVVVEERLTKDEERTPSGKYQGYVLCPKWGGNLRIPSDVNDCGDAGKKQSKGE